MTQRLHPHPYLSVFNGADTNLTTDLRDASTVPPQALFMANSALVHEQASKWAARLISAFPDAASRVRQAFAEAYSRPPEAREVDRATAYVRRYAEALESEGVDAGRREREAWASLARVWFASNEFYHVD